MAKDLRIGVLVDSLDIALWQYEMLMRIQDLDFATIELVVVNNDKESNKSFLSKLTNKWPAIPRLVLQRGIWFLYNLIDSQRKGWRDPFPTVNCSQLLHDTKKYELTPIQSKFSDRFLESDIEQLQQYQIDVFIRLGFRILRGDILSLPTYGVWSYHHGDNRVNRGGPAGFWEVFNKWPETGSTLQILSETLDAGFVLCRSISCTDQSSYIRNRATIYWKTLSFIPRKLEELHLLGPDTFFKRAEKQNSNLELYSGRIFKAPSPFQIFQLLITTLISETKKIIFNHLYFHQWVLLISRQETINPRLGQYIRIEPPIDRFWADPHVTKYQSCFYIFFEEYFYSTKRGRISCLEIDRKGNIGVPFCVLERDYHLSYPFIFTWNDCFYMIPETRENKTIELFKCVAFPHKWEFLKTLMTDVAAVDSTLLEHSDRWWLFTNLIEHSGASPNDELFLFHASSPLSDTWTPHPLNPIVSDANQARCAGAIFSDGGRFYRPSQICVPSYGYGLNLCEIKEINEFRYKEKIATRAEPNWASDVKGIHSFGHTTGLTVCDALIRRTRYNPFRNRTGKVVHQGTPLP